jgi:hypothetical protein
MSTAGLLVTLIFAIVYGSSIPILLLAYVILIGLVWDVLYSFLQSLRWDDDWPPLFVLLGGLAEGGLIWLLVPLLPGVDAALTLAQFALHYLSVFAITLALMLGPIRILLPRWRFRGGRLM